MLALYQEYRPRYMGNDKDPDWFSIKIRRGAPKKMREVFERISEIVKANKDNPDPAVNEAYLATGADLIRQACLPSLSREIEVDTGKGIQKISTIADLLEVTGNDAVLINELGAAIYRASQLTEREEKNSGTPPGDDGTLATGGSAVPINGHASTTADEEAPGASSSPAGA